MTMLRPDTRPLDAAATPTPTPHLVLDVALAVQRYRELQAALPETDLHYAVKANPHPDLLRALASAGCRFDVASPAEVQATLAAGAHPSDLVHSNPVARRTDLAHTAFLGVGLFVVDSVAEAAKLADVAPGTRVLVRLRTSGSGSDWPLSRKFGCGPDEAVDILRYAARRGLAAAGVSFHVGSQQRDPHAWEAPLHEAAEVFARARADGLAPGVVDLGGGFPADHEGGQPDLARYGEVIEEALASAFGARRPATLAEPGRGIVADAGALVARVVAVLDRGGRRWVYLDAGVFTGLVETLDEAIRYRLKTSADGGPTMPCVLAGPTCDSADVLYERVPVDLPVGLSEGDLVTFRSAGAYTSCYSTVGFNGFPPLPVVIV